MSPIIGYGEDSLTYWALRTGGLLRKLGHEEHEADVLLLYRPSFGRLGGSNRAAFGEFDALIGTHRCVYLIESKCGLAKGKDAVDLKQHQLLRHRFFETLRNEWQDWRGQSGVDALRTWDAFCKWIADTSRRKDWHTDYRNKPLAPKRSKLASNLVWVLTRLERYPADIQHVLLHFYRTETPKLTNVSLPNPFHRLVNIPFSTHEPIGKSRFFVMEPASSLV